MDESVVNFLEESNARIVRKVDGYVAALGAASCYRNALDTIQESNIGSLIEEWAEIVSGNRPNETLDLVIKTHEEFKVITTKLLF